MCESAELFRLLMTSPECTASGKLPPRGILPHFKDQKDALSGKSADVLSLDGTWDFNFFDAPREAMTGGPYRHRIRVPGEWDMQGFGHPWYLNVDMPFPNLPPEIPEEHNPTGVYHRSFTLPETWSRGRTVLHFDGVENFFFVLLNGHAAGFAKNSRSVTEFDVTGMLQPGENELIVAVSQFSDAAFIEDQDQWWHGGIFRSITLRHEPEEHLEDVFLQGTLDESLKDGILAWEIRSFIEPKPEFARKYRNGIRDWQPGSSADNWTCTVKLFDETSVLAEKTLPVTQIEKDAPVFTQQDAHHYRSQGELRIPAVRPWSAEHPQLYTVLVTLAYRGEIRDTVRIRTGFRRVEVRDRQLLINGKCVLLCGVNRHEHNPRTGRTVSEADMRRDLELMKQFNINAVRTSHYPDDPLFYDLCDEYGMYVFDEANIECHDFFSDLCCNPQWSAAFLSRAVDLVTRDKNHPSVIVWSLGNESGFGPNQAAACRWIREFDPGRPLLCERATTDIAESLRPGRNRDCTDIVGPMYRPPREIRQWSEWAAREEDRPLILCEYAHAMGNSSGGLADYFAAFRSCRGLQGGFIWEWCDHGIWKKREDGTEFQAFGGDFGEKIHDSNFVTDGLVSPDREPHPGLYELRYLAQPAEMKLIDPAAGLLQLANRRYFTGLDDCELYWETAVNGTVSATGRVPVPGLAPAGFIPDPEQPFSRSLFDRELGNEAILKLDYPGPDAAAGDVCTLTVYLKLKTDCRWAKAGHTVAHEQFILPFLPVRMPEKPVCLPLPEAVRKIFAGGTLHLWRATTDNDGIRQRIFNGSEDFRCVRNWLDLGLPDVPAVHDGEETVYQLTRGREIRHRMTLEDSGDGLLVRSRITVAEGITDLPRLGLELEFPREFMRGEYFGLGPFENHRDRCAGALLGRWPLAADDPCPYIVPQEYGSRCGVRRLTLFGPEYAVEILPEYPMECSFRQYDEKVMQQSLHWYEVPVAPVNKLSLDLYQRGVGTGSCGPDTFAPYRTILPGVFHFDFLVRVRPCNITGGEK